MKCDTFLLMLVLLKSTTAYVINEEACLNYTIYPIQYDILIIPHIYTSQAYFYDCDITITVIVNAPNINVIELDAKDLDIKDGSIKVLHGDVDLVNTKRPYEYNSNRHKLIIYLTDYLRPYSVDHTLYYIKVSFAKHLEHDTSGVFVVTYDDRGQKHLFTTRLSPNKAKNFIPCFDDPRFVSIFKFTVHEMDPRPGVQHTNTSLVIAPEQHRFKYNNYSYVAIEYMPSPQISLHQVGFHHSIFGSNQATATQTNDTIVIWAPTRALKYYTYVLNFGRTIINLIHYYSTVNRPITFGPINIVSVPSHLEGYEVDSWNLLTNGDNRLAYLEQFTSIFQLEAMKFELTQQLCRIWLGNPGESARTKWNEEWFKEGVATYLAYYILAQYDHGAKSTAYRWPIGIYGLRMKNKAMLTDWQYYTQPLITFNKDLVIEIPSRYKDLVTMKTASLIWMMENWLGSDKFHEILVKYINSRRGKTISIVDFMENLDKDSFECQYQFFNGSTAARILNSWFHQRGYPVIDVLVIRNQQPNAADRSSAIQLKQRQFSFIDDDRRESDYLIPISYIVQNSQDCYNCHQPRFTIGSTYSFKENLNNGWIILNRNASGYYRVNYDLDTWKLIAKTLNEHRHSIDELNRAQIVNDAFALYAAGNMDYQLAFEILDYLHDERSDVVWQSAIEGFQLLKIDGAKCHMTKTLYEQWKEFMRRKVSPIYNLVVSDLEQQNNIRLIRTYIVDFACSVDHQPCLNHVHRLYTQSLGGTRMDPDLRQTCYYTVLKNSKSNWQQIETHDPIINRFEMEDKIIAEHRMQNENKFFHKIPVGIPKPIELVMSSTLPPIMATTTSTVQTAGLGSSGSSIVSLTTYVTTVLAALVLVVFK